MPKQPEEVLSVSACGQWDAALFGIDCRNLGGISVSDVDPCRSEDPSSVRRIGCVAQQLHITLVGDASQYRT